MWLIGNIAQQKVVAECRNKYNCIGQNIYNSVVYWQWTRISFNSPAKKKKNITLIIKVVICLFISWRRDENIQNVGTPWVRLLFSGTNVDAFGFTNDLTSFHLRHRPSIIIVSNNMLKRVGNISHSNTHENPQMLCHPTWIKHCQDQNVTASKIIFKQFSSLCLWFAWFMDL